MKYLFLALSTMLAIVAQMIAGNNFLLFNFFDLSLVLIAYWALYRSRVQALFVGSLSGLLMDAALGWPLGYNGFGRTVAAFAIGAAARHFNLDGAPVRSCIMPLGALGQAPAAQWRPLAGRQRRRRAGAGRDDRGERAARRGPRGQGARP